MLGLAAERGPLTSDFRLRLEKGFPHAAGSVCSPHALCCESTRNMESNPMLVDVWHIKGQWACAASDDIRRLCQNTRGRVAEHPQPGPVVQNGLKFGKDVVVEF